MKLIDLSQHTVSLLIKVHNQTRLKRTVDVPSLTSKCLPRKRSQLKRTHGYYELKWTVAFVIIEFAVMYNSHISLGEFIYDPKKSLLSLALDFGKDITVSKTSVDSPFGIYVLPVLLMRTYLISLSST